MVVVVVAIVVVAVVIVAVATAAAAAAALLLLLKALEITWWSMRSAKKKIAFCVRSTKNSFELHKYMVEQYMY